jgi:signal transduction histidine kinase
MSSPDGVLTAVSIEMRAIGVPGSRARRAATRLLARHTWWPEASLFVVCCFWLYLMQTWRGWDIPFYFVYLSVGIVYGLRMWALLHALVAIALVVVSTGGLILLDVARGTETAAELVEVPLLTIFFIIMILHVNSRQRTVSMVARMLQHERRLHAYAAHELMTPLTVARGEVELLLRNGRPSDEVLARAQVVVLDELRRSEQLASDLLLAARVNLGGVERAPTSADDLVLDAVERWRDRMPGPLLVDEIACGTVIAAKDDLSRALDNLLSNAARHTAAGAVTRIASRRDGERLVIIVSDKGSGVGPDDVPHVFDRFYRGDCEHCSGRPGTGLGLAIVKEVVESHGGTVRLASEQGRGTTVTLELPGFEPLPLIAR